MQLRDLDPVVRLSQVVSEGLPSVFVIGQLLQTPAYFYSDSSFKLYFVIIWVPLICIYNSILLSFTSYFEIQVYTLSVAIYSVKFIWVLSSFLESRQFGLGKSCSLTKLPSYFLVLVICVF